MIPRTDRTDLASLSNTAAGTLPATVTRSTDGGDISPPVPGLAAWATPGTRTLAPPDAIRAGLVAPADPRWPQVEGYEIRGRLGKDGMGEVYRALDPQLRREVALKIPRSVSRQAHRQFLGEARALAQVQHPNILAIHSFGRTGENVYFTMELVEGPDSGHLLRELQSQPMHQPTGAALLRLFGLDPERVQGPLERASRGPQAYYRVVALWIAEAAEALHAAHERQILHRDVKPSNLLLAPDGRMMVADFGLARPADWIASDGHGISGTYPYVAPERAAGDWARIDRRADIWALGATLYEFLTLQRAYDRPGKQVLQDIITKPPIPPRERNPHVPAGLEHICLTAMARSPDERYADALTLARALRAWAEQTPTPRWGWVVLTAVAGLAGCALFLHPWRPAADTLPAVDHSVAHGASATQPGEGETPRPPTAHPQPGSPATRATAAGKPTVLVAFNYNLNTDQDRPARIGGQAESLVCTRLGRESARFGRVEPPEHPESWTEETVWSAACKSGAALAVFGELRARPQGRVTGLSTDDGRDLLVCWELTLEVTLISVGTGEVTRLPAVYRSSIPPVESAQYAGNAIPELVADAWPAVLNELLRLGSLSPAD